MNKDLTINNLLLKLKFFEDKSIVKDVNKFLLTIEHNGETVI